MISQLSKTQVVNNWVSLRHLIPKSWATVLAHLIHYWVKSPLFVASRCCCKAQQHPDLILYQFANTCREMRKRATISFNISRKSHILSQNLPPCVSGMQTQASHTLSRLWRSRSTGMSGKKLRRNFIRCTWNSLHCKSAVASCRPPEVMAASHRYSNPPHLCSCICVFSVLLPSGSHYPGLCSHSLALLCPNQHHPDCCCLLWEQPCGLALCAKAALQHLTLRKRSAKVPLVSTSPFWVSKGRKTKRIAMKYRKSCLSCAWLGWGEGWEEKNVLI